MYYELYVDSLFLLNFVMNLLLLLLVNQRTCRTATRGRLILGAALSSTLYILPFLCAGPTWLRFGSSMLLGIAVMVWIPFPVRSFRALRQVIAYFLKYSFLIGGCLLFLLQVFPGFSKLIAGSIGVMGLGMVLFLFLFYRREEGEGVCRVIIKEGAVTVAILGFWDTGNSLVEPISGTPVCVVEGEVIEKLWEKEPEIYRVIPYHSIGKTGYLKGFRIEELRVELYGMEKVFREVYIAQAQIGVSKEEKQEYAKVILNPLLLKSVKEVSE
ncbi:MAG: sigma-E processing peptidase SpoIIGA [Lachnospiraceae bacterium]|nr:sigma-E processing peptidase SpoIIGA [Lachnospiraceae bacterium]